MRAIDYPLARLEGAIDAGLTLNVRSVDGRGTLQATLRSRSGTEISAEGPNLASIASALLLTLRTRAEAARKASKPCIDDLVDGDEG